MYYCRGCFNTLYFSKMCPKFRATPLYCNMDSLVFVTILWMPFYQFRSVRCSVYTEHPVEVLQLMKRAKMWLEAKGYSITLKGTYTKVMEVKF